MSTLTKHFHARIYTDAFYDVICDVPMDYTKEQAIAYVQDHLDEIPVGMLNYVENSDEIDEEGLDNPHAYGFLDMTELPVISYPISTHHNQRPDICPICHQESLDYGVMNVYDNSVGYPWECANCHSRGEEMYNLIFDGHQNIVSSQEEGESSC